VPTVDKPFVGKIIKEYKQIKEEEFIDSDGNKNIIKYYRLSFKDTPEAVNIQNQIKRYKQNNDTMKVESIPYEEGDVRINLRFESLQKATNFDSSTMNYKEAFETEYF